MTEHTVEHVPADDPRYPTCSCESGSWPCPEATRSVVVRNGEIRYPFRPGDVFEFSDGPHIVIAVEPEDYGPGDPYTLTWLPLPKKAGR